MRIMCFTDHDKSWLKYERVSLSNCSFPSVRLHLQFSEWTWITGSFFTWRDWEYLYILHKQHSSTEQKIWEMSLWRNYSVPQEFSFYYPSQLSFCLLPSSHHSSSVLGKYCQVIQWPCYHKKLLWYIGMLTNGVCTVCGEKCNVILHPFCWKFSWSHWGNTKLR